MFCFDGLQFDGYFFAIDNTRAYDRIKSKKKIKSVRKALVQTILEMRLLSFPKECEQGGIGVPVVTIFAKQRKIVKREKNSSWDKRVGSD